MSDGPEIPGGQAGSGPGNPGGPPAPGWWQASDGNWYPPETHPDWVPPAAAPSEPVPAPQAQEQDPVPPPQADHPAPQADEPVPPPASAQPYPAPQPGQPYPAPQPGQPYPAPQAPQPYPGQPYPGAPVGAPVGYPQIPQSQGSSTNGMSIAALVLGIVPFIPIVGSILAIVFGGLARGQIAKSGGRQGGRGMALAGMILGVAWILGIVTLVGIGAFVANRSSNDFNKFIAGLPTDFPTGVGVSPTPSPCSTAVPPRGTSVSQATPPPMTIDPSKTYTATIVTSCGTIAMTLDTADSPNAVNSFVYLADKGFYDGLTFQRIVQDFAIQGGDPNGDGTGGPGYQVVDPVPSGVAYTPGTVAMANAGTVGGGGSQFFIVPDAPGVASAFQPDYSILGKVTSGLDTTVAALNNVNTVDNGQGEQSLPQPSVYIDSITIATS
jgi:cyclophilin family peptidyl-prolyl cis-trans isomerase